MSNEQYYIGIDVGTGSARAILVEHTGRIIAESTHNTRTWRSPSNAAIFEQSTGNIWTQISECVKNVLAQSEKKAHQVMGLGIDATCSLAVVDLDGNPISVSQEESLGNPGERNIILWADHRAHKEADVINASGSEVLNFVGGKMSLEMEIPKILWLKNNLTPEQFARCQFFDLPDYLTYKATGSAARSNCSLVCKTSFVPPGASQAVEGFDRSFLSKIGLDEFAEDARRTGGSGPDSAGIVLTAGLPVGRGLSKEAAHDLGLLEGTPVGSGVIDAYAGWIGTVGGRYRAGEGEELSPHPSLEESASRLAAVAGTSTCHLAQSKEGVFVPGVWGPYKNAVFPGWWMNEGGQSATGQLIEFTITTHPAYEQLRKAAADSNNTIYSVLAEELGRLQLEAGEESLTGLTKYMHMYPDFHGNRSPLADPKMRGSISGLALDPSLGDLALKFNITLEAIALQTRHILDEMNAKGHKIESIYMSGSQAKNMPLMQLMADVCGVPVILPHSPSAAVVIGAAMLGRFAAEVTHATNASQTENERLWEIMVEMTLPGKEVKPAASPREKKLLDAKYKIFRETIDIQRRWRQEMEDASKA